MKIEVQADRDLQEVTVCFWEFIAPGPVRYHSHRFNLPVSTARKLAKQLTEASQKLKKGKR